MDKKDIRVIMKDKLKTLDEKTIIENSKQIIASIKEMDVFKKADSIFFYNSIHFEPKMKDLINYCLNIGKKVYLPSMVFNEMYATEITNDTKYYVGKFGILEPYGDVYFGDIDVTIVPLTAFDKEMNRVGKGGGYYDKYLRTRTTFKLGVAYSFNEVDEIPVENYDVKLDAVVTENGVIKCE